MQTETWGSALFVRPFRDTALWMWALVPMVFAGAATFIGMMLGSNSHAFTISGLMALMVRISPAAANGLIFANDNFGETLGIGIWAVLVYLAMAAGFVAIGWLTQDRKNVAGAMIPVFVYMVLQLWLMAALTPSLVTLGRMSAPVVEQQPTTALGGWEAMVNQGANDLGVLMVGTQPLSLHWGSAFFLMLLMVGLTALAAIGFMTWRQLGLAGLLERPSYAASQGTLVQSPVARSEPIKYCPFCGNELTLIGDSQHLCKRDPRRRRGCGIILENFKEDSRTSCKRCHHPLIRSGVGVTWFCHNCGEGQEMGIGGPMSNEVLESGQQVGV